MVGMGKKKGSYYYPLLLTASAIYIMYITFMNFYFDPKAAEFLSHKINLKRPLQLSVWLNVMHIHVMAACLAMLTGALNFSTTILRNYSKFHRINGYLYVSFIFVVCLTSGYMAPYSTGGKINSIAFNMLNIVWPAMTVAAIVQIKRKQISKHRKWMIRSFVFCFTNFFIHFISGLVNKGFGLSYEASYTIGVYGTICFLFLMAEIVIRNTDSTGPAVKG